MSRAAERGLWVIVDPHQDVWSRFTGGDGAPGWTLEAVGFDLEALHDSGAAIVHNIAGDAYPPMIWPTNYTKLGSATMFTLFFAGGELAPATTIEGVPAQEFLQDHYISAFRALAERLADAPNVLGYETMNEPHPGWIGEESLESYASIPLRDGPTPTPLQAMLAGSGQPTEVREWAVGTLGLKEIGDITLNADARTAWREGVEGVWRANGVWQRLDGRARLLRPRHFVETAAGDVRFDDYFRTFIERYTEAIRSADPDAIVFVVPAFGHSLPSWPDDAPERLASGAHWCDQITLIKKQFFEHFTIDLRSGKLVFGADKIDRMFSKRVGSLRAEARHLGDDAPTIASPASLVESQLPHQRDEAWLRPSGSKVRSFLSHPSH